ncbi:MAG TPA: hypothetical protein VM164_02410, partial [Burkholderiales bacterium]|nr:hypothetical protein [Burkholderiales bacterium]
FHQVRSPAGFGSRMDKLNFWCRWCGSLTEHDVAWTGAQRVATVTSRCSVCGATGSASMTTDQDVTSSSHKAPSADQTEITAAIHQALRQAKKVKA